MQVHEKQKHSTQIKNLNNELKNNQINNKEIKIEEKSMHYNIENKKPHTAAIKDHMIYVLLKNNKNKSTINDLDRKRVQLTLIELICY